MSSERRTQIPDDPDREVTNISRRSSNNQSPINRPRSPRRTPTIAEPQRPGSSSSSNHQKQTFEPPIAIVSPASRQPSAHKTDQQRLESSRPSTAKNSEQHADNASTSSRDRQVTEDEHSKLIKQGEQLQIPTETIDNQRLNSPPPSPSAIEQMFSINPLLGNTTPKATEKNSRPGSQTSRKSSAASSIKHEKHQDGDVVSNKSRTSSRASQQRPKISDANVTSARSGRESQTSEHKQMSTQNSRRSSTDTDVPARTSAEQKQERIPSSGKPKSLLEKRSAQQSRKNSSNTAERTVVSPIKIASAKSQQRQNEKVNLSNFYLFFILLFQRSSVTDSDNEPKVPILPRLHSSSEASTPRNDQQTNVWTKQAPVPPLSTTDDNTRASRPQSPNVEQIAERNQNSSNSKKRTTSKIHSIPSTEPSNPDVFHSDERKKESKRRSNSAESFNQIRMVDDKSLDSTSGNNTESDRPKPRRVKSKKKDVETNTDPRNGNQQQQGEFFLCLSLSSLRQSALFLCPSLLLLQINLFVKRSPR